jgi:hypothetical protein
MRNQDKKYGLGRVWAQFLPENVYLRVENSAGKYCCFECQNPCHLFNIKLLFHLKLPDNMAKDLWTMAR